MGQYREDCVDTEVTFFFNRTIFFMCAVMLPFTFIEPGGIYEELF